MPPLPRCHLSTPPERSSTPENNPKMNLDSVSASPRPPRVKKVEDPYRPESVRDKRRTRARHKDMPDSLSRSGEQNDGVKPRPVNPAREHMNSSDGQERT